MKNECSIIRDLLPLYIENMVSPETAAFVEEHIEVCPACRTELQRMHSESCTSPTDTNIQTAPLLSFRRKWRHKKALLVCSTLLLTAAVIFGVAFAAEQMIYEEQIMVNDSIYIMQKGDEVTDLPAGSIEIGYLRGISHRTTGLPMGNFMGTNLNERYGGCPIWQSGENDRIIYLEDYGGFYIPFIFHMQAESSETTPQ